VLSRFALSESEWQQYLAERQAKKRTKIADPEGLEITGVDARAQESLRRRLEKHAGQPLDPKRLENDLTLITGQGRYQSLDYGFTVNKQNPGGSLLEIRVKEKSHAPPIIIPSVEIDGSDVNAINFTLGARTTLFDVGAYGAEWRIDTKLGFGNLFATEYFRPIGEHGFFVAPHGHVPA
jgi:NTE family protein